MRADSQPGTVFAALTVSINESTSCCCFSGVVVKTFMWVTTPSPASIFGIFKDSLAANRLIHWRRVPSSRTTSPSDFVNGASCERLVPQAGLRRRAWPRWASQSVPENTMPRVSKGIGLAIIGCGRIGSLRARLAKMHPAVGFVAVMDTDASAAQKLAKDIGADFWCTDRH